MILLTTALYREAKPFIRTLGLKKDLSIRSHEVFTSEDYALIVSGIGKINSAIATTLLTELYAENDSTIIGNIGIAGAINLKTGSLRLIHRIRDASTGTCYYPDQLIRSSFTEAMLETHERAITDGNLLSHPETLVDMEGSGFMQAASLFFDTGRIFVTKCVSDNLECGVLTPDSIESLLEPHTNDILAYARALYAFGLESHIEILTAQERGILQHVSKHLLLSQHDTDNLQKEALSYKIKSGELSSLLLPLTKLKIESAEHAKKVFHETRNALSTS